MKARKLYLSEDDRKIAGVCGGLSEAYGVDSTLIRLIWVFVVLATGFVPGIVLYLLAIIIMPEKPRSGLSDKKRSFDQDNIAKHPLEEDNV